MKIVQAIAAVVIAVSACAENPSAYVDAREPFVGIWKAVSVDTAAMPAVIGGVRYDTVTVTLSQVVSSVRMRVTLDVSSPNSAMDCYALVNFVVFAKTAYTTYRSNNIATCGLQWYEHAISMADATTLTFVWSGRKVTLKKAQ